MRLLFLLFVFLTTNRISHQNPVVSQAKHSEAVNDAFIDTLLKRVSYARLVTARYPTKGNAPKLGAGRMVSFSHGANQFTCFKSPDNTFTASMAITSPEPLLAPLLTIGQPKTATLKQLGISRSQDVLQVSNVEGMALATFYFQTDKLVKVTFGATID